MNLGEKILNYRKRLGLTQEELSERIDVTRQTISNWELNETSPNPEQLKKLSKELSVSIDELLDNDIKDVLVKKVTNTENISKKILKLIIIVCLSIIVLFCLLVVTKIIVKNSRERGRKISQSITCEIYGETHSYAIVYYELTAEPIELGGDAYFSYILDLSKYNDAHQIFYIINDYVKKNGGTCEMNSN